MDDDFDEVAEEQDELQEELDPDNPDHAFQILERQFNQTIAEIEQDPQISQYADDFNKMMEILFATHEKERTLSAKYSELEADVLSKQEKLVMAERLQEFDKNLIKELKDQIQMTWKLADAAHAREQAAQEMIDNLRKQVNSLTGELDFKNKMGANDEDEGELSKHKEGLQRERDKLLSEVAKLQERLTNALEYQEELEQRASEVDMKLTEVTTQLEDQVIEIDRYKTLRDSLQTEMTELKVVIQQRDSEISNLKTSVAESNRCTLKVEALVKDQKFAMEKLQRDLEVSTGKHAKLQDELDAVTYSAEKVKKQLAKITTDNKLKGDELAKVNVELERAQKTREIGDKRALVMEKTRDDLKGENEKIKQLITQMEREVQDSKKKSDEGKRNLEKVTREKEIMAKNMLRMQGVQKDQLKLIRLQQQIKMKFESDLIASAIEKNNTAKQIKYLEKERDRLVEEQLDLTKHIEDCMDEFRLKKNEIGDLKKTLADTENRIRMQQNIFDTIRAERNALQKAVQEATAEISEVKVKIKVVAHQKEQLKEDVAAKERELNKGENILRKAIKEKENLRVELNGALDTIRKLRTEIAEMTAEEKRLHKVILKDDRIIRQQAKDLDQLMNERDILGSQLVRRNDELSLLYEKIKILQTTLQRGEAQYEQRLEDIRLLKIEIRRLRQEKHLLTKSVNNMTDLRHEVFYLERDLNKERIKCKALEEELQNPMNMHRWRKLEGSDPEVFELLQKVQYMQKRLLHQTSISIDRERQLKESQRLYMNLKQVLEKQPTPELRNQLVKTQKALTMRVNKMKCLVSELNMSELQTSEYKQDLEKKSLELKNLKQKYLTEKRIREKKELAKGNTPRDIGGSAPQIKFTGGGFRMALNADDDK